MLTAAMINELKLIERNHGGDIPVDAIVEVARNPNSALHVHPAFKWDLHQAAMEHWRDAARQVIRVYTTVLDTGAGERETMRAYCSIVNEQGSHVYRATVQVLREDRNRLIESILDRLAAQISSYPLVELDPVMEAIVQVRIGLAAPKPRRRGRPKSSQQQARV
jgi:hypothetical protein